MPKYKDLGIKLKSLRSGLNLSLSQFAEKIGVDRTYISKLENGNERPSKNTLNNIAQVLNLSRENTIELFNLANYEKDKVGVAVGLDDSDDTFNKLPDGKETAGMSDQEKKEEQNRQGTRQIQVKIPENIHILYTDSAFVTAGKFGIVLDFAQVMGPTDTHTVVARIGMSKDHAEAMMKVLQTKLVEMQANEGK